MTSRWFRLLDPDDTDDRRNTPHDEDHALSPERYAERPRRFSLRVRPAYRRWVRALPA
ncbi:hypothetical protein SAHL_03685 [Salinisphaera orenii YIM 95161]|uniref:Uncharacterized protein n=1 Tax=Salinisphaera orenii YIM 95161 TaxID=1051139 RepID=A0A423Q3P1_9GAMM|nr:hypothetical protein SAHL_03685 [Salinisphaera halophila YIM 95161]